MCFFAGGGAEQAVDSIFSGYACVKSYCGDVTEALLHFPHDGLILQQISVYVNAWRCVCLFACVYEGMPVAIQV